MCNLTIIYVFNSESIVITVTKYSDLPTVRITSVFKAGN